MLSVSSACRAEDAWPSSLELQQPSSPLSSSSLSSEDSVFSADVSSQSSRSSAGSSHEDNWLNRVSSESQFTKLVQIQSQPQVQQPSVVPVQERQHPRRCSVSQVPRFPPTLARGSEKKGQFVDNLVGETHSPLFGPVQPIDFCSRGDSAANMVEIIWPTSTPACFRDGAMQGNNHLSLRIFIQETLRRSRTSFSTLQVALYYLLLIKAFVPRYDFTMQQPVDSSSCRALQCGRRMFLAALILASKYLQDRNYSARAWSKISGLQVCEINTNEMAFLKAINWKLHIPEKVFDTWQRILILYTAPSLCGIWKEIVLSLAPALDNLPPLAKASVDSQPDAARGSPARRWPMSQTSMDCAASPDSYSPPSPMRPRQTPAVLEPTPIQGPPRQLPPAALPTPNFTPASSVCSTPAASAANFYPKPSMMSAMSMAQNTTMARACMDYAPNAFQRPACMPGLEAYRMGQRRPPMPLASDLVSVSDPGSPGSMISDHSHFSRSSSISSASSSQTSPSRSRDLARLAAYNAGQKVPDAEVEQVVILSSGPLSSSPEVDSSLQVEAAEVFSLSGGNGLGRKRHRSITSTMQVDLQSQVRDLLGPSKPRALAQSSNVLASHLAEPRYPVQMGWKRACYPSSENLALTNPVELMRPSGGPGMWKGIL
jgi:hypothetical protein